MLAIFVYIAITLSAYQFVPRKCPWADWSLMSMSFAPPTSKREKLILTVSKKGKVSVLSWGECRI